MRRAGGGVRLVPGCGAGAGAGSGLAAGFPTACSARALSMGASAFWAAFKFFSLLLPHTATVLP